MTLRLARKGPNAGNRFWGCDGYARGGCSGTLSYRVESSTEADSRARLATQLGPDSEPRAVRAAQLHEGLDTVYFAYQTVSQERLEEIRYFEDASRDVGLHWRLSYVRLAPPQLTTEAERALSVVDKLLCRGHFTRLPGELEEALSSPHRIRNRVSVQGQDAGSPKLDSPKDAPAEQEFYERFLPSVLGDGFKMWVTPQIEIASLTGGVEFVGTEARVDFLIVHPDLPEPLVVELDGQQHDAGRAAYDEARTTHLERAGYRVVRIPSGEVLQGKGSELETLAEELSILTRRQAYVDQLAGAVRRAGQVQMALLHALYVGMLPAFSESSVRVSTDLVAAGELSAEDFHLVLADFAELVNRVGALFGASLLPGGLEVAEDRGADLHLGFYGFTTSIPTLAVEDACLPISLKWPPRPVRPGLPASKDFNEESLTYFLKRIFRKPSFLDGQYDIVSRALQGMDTIALLPTGAGKSIAFQLASLLLPGRTIVVAPIISLIRDQVENLRGHGIDRALGITSELAGREGRERAYRLLQHGEAFLYYIAPERFQMREFRTNLRGLTAAYPVNMIVIDEAHCVSEWGHNFRTAYLRIGRTSRECCSVGSWVPPVVALTGTASRTVLKDLQRELLVPDFDAIVTPRSFDREELKFVVMHEKSADKQLVLESYLRNTLPAKFGLPTESFFGGDGAVQCGLVFCLNAGGPFGVLDVARRLTEAGLYAAYYSGSMPKHHPDPASWNDYKRRTEQEFKRDKIPLLVPTKAFGMGVDKPNIRYTVHYGVPPSIEAFYQEAGRAGRDRKPAVCALIVSNDQPAENKTLLTAVGIDEVIRAVQNRPFDDNDDVSRALFLHVQSFRGVEAEIDAARDVLAALAPVGARATRHLPFGKDQELAEKALHRLVVVGIVGDYTVEYSAKEFTVTLANADRESVIDAYCDYVAGYQRARAAQERRIAEQLSHEWDEFVLEAVGLYVAFVYDVIEQTQRRAIAEMLAACSSGDGEDLRKRVLAYLEQTEFSETLDAMLDEDQAGLGLLNDVMNQIVSPNEAVRLRGSVARSLEAYPDHPGLLLLRAVSEALARDTDEQTVLDNFQGFLTKARDVYALPTSVVTRGAATALRYVCRKDRSLARMLEMLYLDHERDREQLRLLIAQCGVRSSAFAPWMLLEESLLALESRQWPHQQNTEVRT